jgi:autotransporter-associated beta strand protein
MNTNYTVSSPDALILDVTGLGGNRAADTMGAAVAKSGGNLTIDGNGTLRVTGGSGDVLGIADTPGRSINISLGSGGLVDIQGGALVNGGWGGGNWSANLADMNIASGAIFDIWDGGAIRVDALTGAGSLQNGSNSPTLRSFTLGVDGGSGTFSGVIGGGTGRAGNNRISLTKEGAATQILSGNNTYAGTTTVTAGTLQIGDGATTGSLGSGNVSITGNLTFNRSNNYGTGSAQVFSGAGTITKEGAGDLVFNGGVNHTNVQAITQLTINNGLVRTDNWGQWNSNLNLTVNDSGKFEMWNGNASLATLNGDGTVQNTKNWSRPTQTLTVAAGSFSGSITDLGITTGGAGTGDTRINLVKSGAGTLTLSGTTSYTGTTTVEEGTLSLGNGTSPTGLSDDATVSIASGATVNLNFSGSDTVGKLIIAGTTVPAGDYNGSLSTPAEYRSYFTGTGSLTVLGQNGAWISSANGDWSDSINWQDGTIATGTDKTATFSAAGGPITVTLDSNRIIGNLSFSNADYTIGGANVLTLESTTLSTLSVATGNTATISTALAGTPDVEKTGSGALILNGANSLTGLTTLTAGTLELQGAAISNFRSSTDIASGSTLKLTGNTTPYVGGNYNGLALGSASPSGSLSLIGAGSLVVNGFVGIGNANGAPVIDIALESGSLIDIQSGALVNGGWGKATWSGNLADMNIASGASFDIWDGQAVTIDSLSGSGTVRNGSNDVFRTKRMLTIGADNGSSTFDGVIGGGVSGGSNAAINCIAITKTGTGTITLAGANTYIGDTTVDAGSLVFSSTSQLQFVVTEAPASNQVTGAGTATFNGTFNINTTGVSGATGHIWLLVDRATLTGESFGATFSVAGFTPQLDGITWTMSDAKGDWTFSEDTGELTLDIGNDYDDWATANGVVGGENDDDDSDGLTNFEEYAFGLDPTGGSSVNPILVQLDKGTGTFSYQRRKPSLTGLAFYKIQTSTDLVNWIEDTTAGQVATDIPFTDNQSVVVTLTTPPTAAKFFVRVSAE